MSVLTCPDFNSHPILFLLSTRASTLCTPVATALLHYQTVAVYAFVQCLHTVVPLLQADDVVGTLVGHISTLVAVNVTVSVLQSVMVWLSQTVDGGTLAHVCKG
jgi:hypothetical protein